MLNSSFDSCFPALLLQPQPQDQVHHLLVRFIIRQQLVCFLSFSRTGNAVLLSRERRINATSHADDMMPFMRAVTDKTCDKYLLLTGGHVCARCIG